MTRYRGFCSDDTPIAAIARAKKQGKAWNPVYADVFQDGKVGYGQKIGHICSDGYSNSTWLFFPTDKKRRSPTCGTRGKPLDSVIPKWASRSYYGPFRTLDDLHYEAQPLLERTTSKRSTGDGNQAP